MAIETFNSISNKAEEATQKQQQSEVLKQEAKNANKDQIITLDIENRNAGFREKGGVFRRMGESAKNVWGSIKNKWQERNKMVSVIPEEYSTKARYEATLKTTEASVNQITEESEAVAERGEMLAQQSAELEAIQQAVAELTKEKSPKKSPEILQPSQLKELAGLIQRAGPKVEGGFGPMVEALNSGKLDASMKEKVVGVIDQLSKEFKLTGEIAKTLGVIKENFTSELGVASKNSPEKAEDSVDLIHEREVLTSLSKLVEEHNPLNTGNKLLADALKNDDYAPGQIQSALLAVDRISTMAKWDKNTNLVLQEAKNILTKSVIQEGKIVSIDTSRTNQQTTAEQPVDVKKAA